MLRIFCPHRPNRFCSRPSAAARHLRLLFASTEIEDGDVTESTFVKDLAWAQTPAAKSSEMEWNFFLKATHKKVLYKKLKHLFHAPSQNQYKATMSYSQMTAKTNWITTKKSWFEAFNFKAPTKPNSFAVVIWPDAVQKSKLKLTRERPPFTDTKKNTQKKNTHTKKKSMHHRFHRSSLRQCRVTSHRPFSRSLWSTFSPDLRWCDLQRREQKNAKTTVVFGCWKLIACGLFKKKKNVNWNLFYEVIQSF